MIFALCTRQGTEMLPSLTELLLTEHIPEKSITARWDFKKQTQIHIADTNKSRPRPAEAAPEFQAKDVLRNHTVNAGIRKWIRF